MSKKSFLIISLISTMLLVASAYGEERVKREMVINHVEEIGLEIWSENNPTWMTQIRKRGPKFEFVAETPRSYYPPAAMHYMHFAGMEVKGGEMEGIALNAIQLRIPTNPNTHSGGSRTPFPPQALPGDFLTQVFGFGQ